MDNETQHSELSSYVQDLQNKISIGVAIAVIKSKPERLSTQEYVNLLQKAVLKEWQKRTTPDIFEDKLVSLQLIKVAHDVAEVLPDSPKVEDDDSPLTPGCFSYLVEDTRPPSPLPDDAAVQEHGVLFKSLAQLKFATETKKTVLFGRVRQFIDEAKECSGNHSNHREFSSPKESQVSKDSGVATSAGCPARGPNSVSTSLFKSITHSADTEALIVKTTRSLLNYVRFAVFNSPFDCYCNWKGSLLEKTCSILAGALTDAHCRAAVTTFLGTSLDQIWTTDDMFKSFAIEHQLLILSTLCQVSDVCASALNNVMVKCEEFVVDFSNGDPPSPFSIHKIEKIPHFLYFAEILLSRWKQRASKKLLNDSKDQRTSTQGSASNQLWRLRTNEGDNSLDKSEMLTSSWRETIERLSFSSVEVYPLVNSHLLRTLSALSDPNETVDPFEDGPNSFFGSFKT